MNASEIPFGGGFSQIYPPPEGAVNHRVRPDHRDHSPGGPDSRSLGLVGDREPVQHGGGRYRLGYHGRELLRAGGHPRLAERHGLRGLLGRRPQPHVL